MGVRARRVVLALGFMVGAGGACDGSSIGQEAGTTSDRASESRVVSNPAPNVETPTLVLDTAPVIVLGGQRADTEEELWAVVHAMLTSELDVLVTYNAGRDLRRYNMRGELVRRIGGAGIGPGEFRRITQLVALAGDTIAVLDGRSQRISTYAGDGTFLRSTRTASGSAICCTATGVYLDRAPISRLRNNGTTQPAEWMIRSLSTVPSGESRAREAKIELPSDPGRFAIPDPDGGYSVPNIPFKLAPIIRLADSTIISATGESYEYRVFSSRGMPLRTVRAAFAPAPLTEEMIAAERASFGSVFQATDPRKARAFVAAFDALRQPATLPAFDRILTEENGSVWIRHHGSVAAGSEWWARFDAAGALLGTLRIPPGSRVIRFSRGHAILARTDSVGFDQLSVLAIRAVNGPP
jgi:hypothetical protein